MFSLPWVKKGEPQKTTIKPKLPQFSSLSASKLSNEKCALCQQPGTEEKWAGQFWHKKCLRKARKIAKSVV
jgi:hypothetical protein